MQHSATTVIRDPQFGDLNKDQFSSLGSHSYITDFRVPLEWELLGGCIPSTVQTSDFTSEQETFCCKKFKIWSVNYWLHSWTVQTLEKESVTRSIDHYW
jgi:hypothetical protein